MNTADAHSHAGAALRQGPGGVRMRRPCDNVRRHPTASPRGRGLGDIPGYMIPHRTSGAGAYDARWSVGMVYVATYGGGGRARGESWAPPSKGTCCCTCRCGVATPPPRAGQATSWHTAYVHGACMSRQAIVRERERGLRSARTPRFAVVDQNVDRGPYGRRPAQGCVQPAERGAHPLRPRHTSPRALVVGLV